DALGPINRLTAVNRGFMENKFDVILTNPPFGSMVKQEEKPYLSNYEMSEIASAVKASAKVDPKMGKKMVKKRTSVKTEILYCEQIWRFLKRGTGRAAIVLPDG